MVFEYPNSMIQHFFVFPHFTEDNKVVPTRQPSIRKFRKSVSYMDDTVAVIHDVSASWLGDPNMLALKNMSARIRKGKLCAIIGAVGSGKVCVISFIDMALY